ncbi:hypothetical protein AURANDRAFT_54293 [Aureococcus anophagefferens]|uniref:Uncharacterized protein n=1 Tax=Aureococcus anophagefferens TaxID=44056 RepID=F0YF07_AURAN|nr:hypothetical protein AURANDRAFT_54293 [Aureococcus anophagefferens]EGB06381.1 hypothetical protein AURANDRAFT_54293 [Aureococcus anophagefferens]|eukprot:XP_009038957.1 hypothetical protein AURANDRAFT_54293 [Aureococcus anophagefferens]
MYEYEEGVKLDKKKAERLYRAAADRGEATAQCNLGAFLHSDEKFEEAFRYFVLAANQGYTPGEFNLGCCYQRGKGTELDLGKARYWFERAAAKGDEDAIDELARLDARKAAKIYRRAVELGDVDAMINLGLLYRTGSGVKLDKKKAERLYRAAADRGHAVAQCNQGNLLYSEKKFEEAFRYYALAADQGHTKAEYNLGICYRDGEGTEVDLGKARYWFERAAAKGHEKAIKALADLDAQV